MPGAFRTRVLLSGLIACSFEVLIVSLSDRLRAARETAAATPLPPGRPSLVLIVSDRDPHGRTVTREPMLPMQGVQTDRDAALPAWRRRDLTKDLTGEVRS